MSPERNAANPPYEVQPNTENLRKGALVRYLRIQRGFSQKLLADETNTSQGYISQVENEETENLSYIKTINIARTLGVGIHFWENGLADTKVFMCFQAKTVENIMNSEAPESLKTALRQYLETIPDIPPSGVTYIDHFPTQQKLKNKLKTRRRELGIFQYEIQSRSGISQGYFSQLEGAKSKPPKEPFTGTIVKLAEALDFDIYDLLDLKEITPPDWLIKIDTFFRSETVPPETKKRTWQIISLMLDQARDQFFYTPQPKPET